MTDFDYPAPTPSRPLWLVTLADLALLLIGFLVLVQAMGKDRRPALADSLRAEFGPAGLTQPAPAPTPAPIMPVAAAALHFAPGSAIPVAPDADLGRWAREALADPRVRLSITGATDGSPADVDPVSRSAIVLAADRARAAAALIGPAAADRVILSTATAPGRRHALVTLVFSGESRRKPR
ncbi:flagellar motor protein MotB [Sphingomonas sp.]|uniref:flagellar motor protein MotB n=1 Tax=Sphingomonas sp. TaxID=28214 RepID=UPI0031DD6C28